MAYYRKNRRWKNRRRRKRGGEPFISGKLCVTPKSAYLYAKNAFNYLSGLVNSEMHHSETTLSAQAVSTTPVMSSLTAIAQGDTNSTRTGNSIFVRKLDINLTLYQANNVTSLVKVVIFRDKQQVGDTAPGFTDVYSSVAPTSMLTLTNLGRFDILYHRIISVDAVAGNPQKVLRINKVMRRHVRYNGSASTDIQKGGLYIALVSDEATSTVTADMTARLSFYDN